MLRSEFHELQQLWSFPWLDRFFGELPVFGVNTITSKKILVQMSLVFRKPLVTIGTTYTQTLNHQTFHLRALFSMKSHLLRIGVHTSTTAMHPLPYITVGIARLDFKPPLHIISYRLNPPMSLQHTYYASVKHFTTYMYPLYHNFFTGCIRYIILLSVIFSSG